MNQGTGPSMYQCGMCDLSFTDPAQLANHMKCHMEVRLIQCSGCAKYFLDPPDSTGGYYCVNCKNKLNNSLVWNQTDTENVKLDNQLNVVEDSETVKLETPVSVSVEVVESHKGTDYLADDFRSDADVDSYSSLQDSEPENNGGNVPNNMYAVSFMKFVSNTTETEENENIQLVHVDSTATESSNLDQSSANDMEGKVVKKKKSVKKLPFSQNQHVTENPTVLEADSKTFSSSNSTDSKHFGCGVCKTKFDVYEDLKEHLRKHDSKPAKPYVCGICNYCCKLATDLKRHLSKHTGAKPHQCKLCGKTFGVSQALSRHMKMHDGVKPHVCDVCDKAFTEKSKLQIHKRIHSGEKPYQCKFCVKTFASLSTRNVHLRVHTGERPYSCKRCGKAFYQASGLSEHEKLHLSEKPHKCNICGRGFSQYRPFVNHKRTHTGERPYKCSKCGRGFISHQTLYYHVKNHDKLRQNHEHCDVEVLKKLVEEDEKNKCKYCWKTFENPEELETHNVIHAGDLPFLCEICEERFDSQNIFRKHLRSKHRQCFDCGKVLSNASTLAAHKKVHVSKCKICNKTFRNANQLTDHYRVHTREKPFQCATCGKMFRLKASLFSHQSIHTGFVAYICEICGKQLKCKSTLCSHMRTHSKEN